MLIKKLQTLEEISRAFDSVKSVFPDLGNRVNIRDYLKKISEFAYCICAIKDDEVCGFAAMYNNDIESGTAYITLIGVDGRYRNMYIGSQLLEYLQKEALLKGMKQMKLEVNNNNSIAITFYTKHGFEPLKKASDFSIYMIKNLT